MQVENNKKAICLYDLGRFFPKNLADTYPIVKNYTKSDQNSYYSKYLVIQVKNCLKVP